MDEALEWLKRSKSNLKRGKDSSYLDIREITIEDLCFDLQQSVEKAIKALLISKGIPFKKIHDIAVLLTLLKNNQVELPDYIAVSAKLTRYAVETRYPGDYCKVTEEDYKETLKIAEDVYNWVKIQIDNKE